MISLLSQQNKSWAGLHIPPSSRTIGQIGCMLTDLSMATSMYGTFFTPTELLHILKFNNNGEVLWDSLANSPEMAFKLEKRLTHFDPVEILNSLVDPKRFVILWVNNCSHFVLALRKDPFHVNQYIVADPLDGKKKSTYKNFFNIVGSRHFILK